MEAKPMKKSSLPGMAKYGTVREALRAIAKKTEEHHKSVADQIKKSTEMQHLNSQVVTK